MLILSRKLNECIVIDGKIIIKVLRLDKDTVKLGIQAPPEMPVHRQEVYDQIQKSKQAGANNGAAPNAKPPVAELTPSSGTSNPSSAPSSGKE
jgi:carbon storage regulator